MTLCQLYSRLKTRVRVTNIIYFILVIFIILLSGELIMYTTRRNLEPKSEYTL